MRSSPSALLLTGTVGTGKTTTAAAVGDLLAAAGTPHAVVDLDEIRRLWPTPDGDPFALEVQLANLAAVAANYRQAGAVRLVVAGVCESRAERARVETAVGTTLTVVRLRVDPAPLRQRLEMRHAAEPESRAWHLHRSGELDAVLDAADLADLDLAVADRTPAAVAAAVLVAVGWA